MDRSVSSTATTTAAAGLDALADGTRALRQQAQRVSDSTVLYIRDEPVKSVLIAAAAGAALMALAGLLSRSRRR